MAPPRQRCAATFLEALRVWQLQAYSKPLRFFSFLVILPLVLVLFTTHRVNVALGRRQALHNLGVTAELAAQLVDRTLQETRLFEQMLATQPAFRQAIQRGDGPPLTKLLEDALQLVPRVSRAAVSTPEGTVIAVFPEDLRDVGQSVAQDDGFRGAQQGGWHPYVSSVHLQDGSPREKVVDITLPVREGPEVIGLLMVQYRVEEVRLWFQKIRVEPGGFLYLVDQHDQLVTYPFQVLPGKPKVVSDWTPVAQVVPETGSTLVFRGGRHNELWLAGVHPVGTTGWRIVAAQPEHEVLRLLHSVLWPMGLLVSLLVTILLTVSLQWVQLQRWRLLERVERTQGPSSA